MRQFVRFLTLALLLSTNIALAQEKVTYESGENWVTRLLDAGGKIETVTGFKRQPDWKERAHFTDLKAAEELPATYDLRDKIPGGLMPIKNQGSCGSCWAFSVTAVVEGLLKMKDPTSTPNLSEQTLVDCSPYNCGGGDFDAFNYIRDKGLATTKDYPYYAQNRRCKVSDDMVKQKVAKWFYVGTDSKSPTTEQIKTAIMQYGIVSVDVSASGGFSGYKSGVYNSCNSGGINHMVDLVGWNDADGGYWIMRNSWGSSWGEDGYMRIRYVGKSGKKCNQIGETTAYAVLE